MIPACTGLPPGELMSSTKACEPSSSSALRMAATTNSALASAPLAISPLMSTTAVWGVLLLALGDAWRRAAKATAAISTSHARRKKIFQRRALRCSWRAEKASFSSVARSQPGSRDESLTDAPEFVAACAHRSGAGLLFGSKPEEPGCWGSVMSYVLGTATLLPAHRAGWHQATAHKGNSSGFSRTLRVAGCRQYASAPHHRFRTKQFSPARPGTGRPRTGRG